MILAAVRAPEMACSQAVNDWDIVIQAIEKGDLAVIQKIVPSRIQAYQPTKGGRYLFAIAKFHKQKAITDYLAWQAIIPAIEQDNVDVVKELVGKGYIAANAKTKGGRSLLKIAEYHQQKDIVDYLQSLLQPSQKTSSSITTKAATNKNVIEFYDKNKPYYEFTNFYTGEPISMDGKKWPTSEHYFQAMKFEGKNSWIQEKIRNAASPRDVFDLANSKSGTYKAFIRSDWDNVKDTIMHKVLLAKFTQNSRLGELLLDTGSAELVEASPIDSYWGYGPDKKGKNMLGKILMQVRDELIQVQIDEALGIK